MNEISTKLVELQNAIISSNVSSIVSYVISYALDLLSSDIHIEPEEQTTRVRYRVDGRLRQIVEYPPNIHSAVVARIKVMSNLKIDETRIPQDGRTQVTTKDGRAMDLRVSTLPTVNGEKIVMRLQDRSRKIPDLPELGIDGRNLAVIEKGISAPNGIVLTTGPTGSGKTTTLYSCLTRLNQPEVNIMTIEDPVEIQMDGLNQSQVHAAIDYTFAVGLRCALRQDPDIIMVGEIRDRETIGVATEAALTGHLVLSTIHTNSAAATITRLTEMGIPSFLLTATLNVIIAQRLVRRICPDCKTPTPLDAKLTAKLQRTIASMNPEELAKLQIAPETPLQIWHGAGCANCSGLGYRGRVGLYEVMDVNPRIKEIIGRGANNLEIEKAAIESGMRTLEQDGVIKILAGITTPEEVYTVAQHEDK